MSRVELTCPTLSNPNEMPQTDRSKVLRTTSVALGVLGTSIGLYFLLQVGQLALIIGAVSVIVGGTLLFLGIFVREAQDLNEHQAWQDFPTRNYLTNQEFGLHEFNQNNDWILTEEEQRALFYISMNPRIRAGDYIGSEILEAFICMNQGRENEFQQGEHSGHGTHTQSSNNAREYLNSVIQEESALRTIIDSFNSQENNQDFEHSQIAASILNRIIQKITRLLN